jgi:hypothetical protein
MFPGLLACQGKSVIVDCVWKEKDLLSRNPIVHECLTGEGADSQKGIKKPEKRWKEEILGSLLPGILLVEQDGIKPQDQRNPFQPGMQEVKPDVGPDITIDDNGRILLRGEPAEKKSISLPLP